VTASWLRRAVLRWRVQHLAVRLAVQAAVGALIGFAAFRLLISSSTIDATAASVLVAVFFGIFTVLQQRQSQRRQHTVELITAFQTAEELCAADRWMAERIAGAEPVGPDLEPAAAGHVMVLLDYYEFLAVLAQRGMVDVPLLMDLRGGAMARCYAICDAYLADRRARVFAGLYVGLGVFVATYNRRVA
jgi:hypothetical protein